MLTISKSVFEGSVAKKGETSNHSQICLQEHHWFHCVCCYNQVVVVTSTYYTETSETVRNVCVVVEGMMLY